MSAIDDLLSQRRRGALSDADERRLQMAVHTSREHQLTVLAGEIFERAGAPQAGDTALIKTIVRRVEGEWSGTFQRVVARRRLSRWLSVPVLMASLAGASFGGYRAWRAPSDNPVPVAVAAATPSAAGATPAAAPSVAVPAEEAPREPAAVAIGAVGVPVALPEVAAVPLPALAIAAADPAASDRRASLSEPAAARSAAATVAAPVASTSPSGLRAVAAAGHPAAATWNLPRPKRRTLPAVAPETELAAVLPVPSPAESASAGTAPEAAPDLESARALFRRANQLRQTDWDAAASLYERLTLRHSEAPEAGVAEMALGKHALAEGRARQALLWFEAYQRRKGGELGAEALWGEARALQSLGESERAHELWQRLIDQYPASAYGAAAREQLGP